ncbi:MAG: zinc ABC transporter substrate-binding protein [Candidatus Omnitrophica bacterium]|nr:zinc ABC transporter substrate-binding protein [Candidatus Omnitrophota bacterium]
MLKKTINRSIFYFVFFLSSIVYLLSSMTSLVCAQKPLRIVTSFYPMYIMALNVTKDIPGVVVENLTSSQTGCLHDYALTPDDMKKLTGANLFVANGAGMENFLNNITARYSQIKIVQLADGISLIKNGNDINPHVWTSISNAIKEVENLSKALEIADPSHQKAYSDNAHAYVIKLKKIQTLMHKELYMYIGEKIITFHEAFPYFAQEFGLNIAAVIEREPGSEPSAKELADTIDLVKKTGIKALFTEPQYPALAAQTIAQETEAKIFTLDPAVTGPEEPDAYINIMTKNLKVLKSAFTQ